LQGKSELKKNLHFQLLQKLEEFLGFMKEAAKNCAFLTVSFIIILLLGENGSYTLPFSPQKWKNHFFDFLRTEIVRLKNQSDNWQGLVPFLIPPHNTGANSKES